MARRLLEKMVEMPSLKATEAHESGAGDTNSKQKRNKWNLTKQVAFFALAELAGARQRCVLEFPRASQHGVSSLVAVSNRGKGQAKLQSEGPGVHLKVFFPVIQW